MHNKSRWFTNPAIVVPALFGLLGGALALFFILALQFHWLDSGGIWTLPAAGDIRVQEQDTAVDHTEWEVDDTIVFQDAPPEPQVTYMFSCTRPQFILCPEPQITVESPDADYDGRYAIVPWKP